MRPYSFIVEKPYREGPILYPFAQLVKGDSLFIF